MDPKTRKMTMEMGQKLKEIIREAVSLYDNNPTITDASLKTEILHRIGPLPPIPIAMPLPAVKMLYEKLFDDTGPNKVHSRALEAVVRIFQNHPPSVNEVKAADCAGDGAQVIDDNNNQNQAPIAILNPIPKATKSSASPVAVAPAQPAPAAQPQSAPAAAAPPLKEQQQKQPPPPPSEQQKQKQPSPAPTIQGHVTKDQYEKILSRMSTEERSKHPPYEVLMRQYQSMDTKQMQRTLEAGQKLREYMKASIEMYRGIASSHAKYMQQLSDGGTDGTGSGGDATKEVPYSVENYPLELYKKKVVERFGPVPDYPQWYPVNYTHLCTMYKTIYNKSSNSVTVTAALRALEKLLPRGSGNNHQATTGTTTTKTTNTHHSNKKEAALLRQDTPDFDYTALPRTVRIVCNHKSGDYIVRSQMVKCNCSLCKITAKAADIPELILSVNEFERHCGMGQAKKWKWSFKLAGNPVESLGHWLDGHKVPMRLTRGTRDDALLAAAEFEWERQAGAGKEGTAAGAAAVVAAVKMAATLDLDESKFAGSKVLRQYVVSQIMDKTRGPGEEGGGGSNRKKGGVGGEGTNGEQAKAHSRKRKPEKVTNSGWEAGLETEEEGDQGNANGRGNQRAPRQRKKPEWMRQTVGPNAVLYKGRGEWCEAGVGVGGEAGAGAGAQAGVGGEGHAMEDDKPQIVAGPRGGVKKLSSRPPTASVELPDGQRVRVDSNILLHAEIDSALSRGLQPEVAGWRVNEANQLAVTVRIGGVSFSGLLPARDPRRASSQEVGAVAYRLHQEKHQGGRASPVSVPMPHQPLNVSTGTITTTEDGEGGGKEDEHVAKRQKSTTSRQEGKGGAPAVEVKEEQDAEKVAGAVVLEEEEEEEEEEYPKTRAAPPPPYIPDPSSTPKDYRLQDDRRAMSAAEFDRLLISGPPPGAKCAMCNLTGSASLPHGSRDPITGKSNVGLGELILIKASAVSNAWVHDQCARWSPDVYDPHGDGILEGIPAAVRRGRMLKCRRCNEKGATLGCLKASCKHSFHLTCARKHGCLLSMDPYCVACPEHVDQLPVGLMAKLGIRGGKKGKSTSAAAMSR